MKIDIHVHTKKIKSGDSVNRNVTVEKFSKIIKSTDVKILAITNHNHFDLLQYEQFKNSVDGTCQVWPGIELDVVERGRRAHLIVIVKPDHASLFCFRMSSLLEGKSADTFSTNLQEIVDTVDDLDSIYVAHYYAKKPNLEDEDVENLTSIVSNPKRIIKEATNSISAGIYISHGHNSIYGSDVYNWDDYLNISNDLPELRLPVESFEQFCLLLEKDDATINTLLDKKTRESIHISTFGVAEAFDLNIYNDINILFGSKGTGKTEILKALSKYFNNKGYKTDVYESNRKQINDVYDLRCADFKFNLEELGLQNCEDEFDLVKNATDKEVTSLAKYRLHYSVMETNKISKEIAVKNYSSLDESEFDRKLLEVKELFATVAAFKEFANSNQPLKEIIGAELFDELTILLQRVENRIMNETEERIISTQAVKMFNSFINVFVTEISKKTGQPEKPLKTGFSDYAANRLKIERAIKKILLNIQQQIQPIKKHVGSLGIKGNLHCQTNIRIQNGNFTDSNYHPLTRTAAKAAQKAVAKKLFEIAKHIFSGSLFEKISELNEIDDSERVKNITDLAQVYRHFVLEDQYYQPSSGESSMILLENELRSGKEIFLIDEPEKSLGNDYINDVIVPILKELALMGKKIVIATHDANIAVRTLPYNSIYRKHHMNRYFTFTGNPFSNSLKCVTGDQDDLDWKEISMKTLEGGRAAFGERGKIYGHV